MSNGIIETNPILTEGSNLPGIVLTPRANISLEHYTFRWHDVQLTIYVPEPVTVQQHYLQLKENDPQTPFPYWTRIWPSSLALARFLIQHKNYVAGKYVVELAAGLGLPSLVASQWAKRVDCSDYSEEAMQVLERTIAYNQIHNVFCHTWDWNLLPTHLQPEVLLLSDVNYEPAQFDNLFRTLELFINKGATVLLSTPQRLMAKSFLERLLVWKKHQEEVLIGEPGQEVTVTVLVLQG